MSPYVIWRTQVQAPRLDHFPGLWSWLRRKGLIRLGSLR